MALIPNRVKPARGIAGTWANMEASNARSMFAESEFIAGIPVALGTDEMTAKPIEDDSRFIGIALRTNDMDGTPVNDEPAFAAGQIFAVADMGTVFVTAGASVSEGDKAFYNPSDNKFYPTSATGRIELPGCEFDENGAADEATALRIRIAPGGADVSAAS